MDSINFYVNQSINKKKCIIILSLLAVMFCIFVAYLYLNNTKKLPSLQKRFVTTKKQAVFLRQYAIKKLNLVGSLVDQQQAWALVSGPNHRVTKIKIKDLVGKEKMQVINILPGMVKLQQLNSKKSVVLRGKTGSWIQKRGVK